MPFVTNLRGMTLATGDDYKIYSCDTRAFVDLLKKAVLLRREHEQDSTCDEAPEAEILPFR